MRIVQLRVQGVRNLKELQWLPGPGLNIVWGENGAGKTSLLEAVCLLSRGRSFRTGYARPVLAEGAASLSVSGRVEGEDSGHQLGMRRGASGWEGRLDGRDASNKAELARALPVLVFEPASHELVEGSPEARRRYLDWGVFHVEPNFGRLTRRYRKALKQRNAALRTRGGATAAAFEDELAQTGERIASLREHYLSSIVGELIQTAGGLNEDLGPLGVTLDRGWDAAQGLRSALEAGREQDLRTGRTHRGPHRAELKLTIGGRPAGDYLSRGQQKILGLSMILCQAHRFHVEHGQAPVLLLDDLASELDAARLRATLDYLGGLGAQIVVTLIRESDAPKEVRAGAHRFHVEHGELHSVV